MTKWVRSNGLALFSVGLYVVLRKLTGISEGIAAFLTISALLIVMAINVHLIRRESFWSWSPAFAVLIGGAAGALMQVAGFPIYVWALTGLLGIAASFFLWSRVPH